MKRFIDDPERVASDSLRGIAAAFPDRLVVDVDQGLILRRGAPVAGKVAVVSGGGSGHDPMHSGYVGRGMLDAACVGPVFTAPVPDVLMAATRAVTGPEGVVYVIKNYTGDVLNFGLAASLAADEGIAVEQVVVADDVATAGGARSAGRRGTGATPLIQKIAGAAAERGWPLDAVAAVARRAAAGAHSYGVALRSCTVPGVGTPTFVLGEDEMEVGVGIHGEQGRKRMPIMPVGPLIAMMTDALLADFEPPGGAELLAVMNGLGGTSLMELYIAFGELVDQLESRGLTVTRRLVGNYVTTLDMEGLSITLLLLDPELTALWDDPVDTAGLRWGT